MWKNKPSPEISLWQLSALVGNIFVIYIFLEDFIVNFSTLSNLRNISMITLFFITEGFSFPDYFSMPHTLYTGFSDLWRLRLCLTSALATFRCLLLPGCPVSILSHFTTNAMALSGLFFYPQASFTLHSFPHFGAFGIQMREGIPNSGSSYLPALIQLSLLASVWSWATRRLFYQLCESKLSKNLSTNYVWYNLMIVLDE